MRGGDFIRNENTCFELVHTMETIVNAPVFIIQYWTSIEGYDIKITTSYGIISSRLIIGKDIEISLYLYRAVYGSVGIYGRPLDMFMCEGGQEKYPDVDQEYRLYWVEVRCCNVE